MVAVPDVAAAGNAANPRAQVITAAGEGSAAAIAINTRSWPTTLTVPCGGPPCPPRRLRPSRHDRQRHSGGLPVSATPTSTWPVPPPSRHQLALMIWLWVFPTLTALNLALGDQLASMSPVVRTF